MYQNCHILTIPVVGNPNTLLTSFNRDSKPLQPLSLESYLKDSFVLPGKGGNCEKYLLLCNVPPSPPHRPRRTRWRLSLFHILLCLVSCIFRISLSCIFLLFLQWEKLGKGCLSPPPTDTPRRFVWGKDPDARAYCCLVPSVDYLRTSCNDPECCDSG